MSTTAITSAPSLDKLTPQQREERYAKLRASLGSSRLAVKGLPGIHYFWADMNHDDEMMRLEGLEYSIVREPDAAACLAGKAKPKIRANYLKADGTYNNGDVILMQCDQDVYDFLMLHDAEKHQQRVDSAQRDFRAEAEAKAVPTFDHTKKGA